MKKNIVSIICVLILSTTYSLPSKLEIANPIKNNLIENILIESDESIYKLFATQNMWNFIKLNTRNGQMWQVQYGVEEKNRFETPLNLVALVTKENEANDRFTLYSTQNIYTFILLDKFDGRTWQVQWSMQADKRLVFPIE